MSGKSKGNFSFVLELRENFLEGKTEKLILQI